MMKVTSTQTTLLFRLFLLHHQMVNQMQTETTKVMVLVMGMMALMEGRVLEVGEVAVEVVLEEVEVEVEEVPALETVEVMATAMVLVEGSIVQMVRIKMETHK